MSLARRASMLDEQRSYGSKDTGQIDIVISLRALTDYLDPR